MIESPFSFLNSEPLWPDEGEVGKAKGGSEFSIDIGSKSGDSDITESLFSSLLDDKNIDFANDSDNDSDDMTNYLKGKRKHISPDKKKNTLAIQEQDVIVSAVTNAESSIDHNDMIDVGSDNVITLFAKDLPKVESCTIQLDQSSTHNKTIKSRPVRSRQPLMSSAPTFVLKQVESKRPSRSVYNSRSNSDDENFSMESKGSKCMSKNAILARELREKKKKYVQELENTVDVLKSRNCDLETKYSKQSKHVKSLESEVQYLRNVLANQTTIASLLNSVHKTPGISFTSSIGQNVKRKCSEDSESQQSSAHGVYVQTNSTKKMKNCNEELDNKEESPSLSDHASVKSTAYKSLIAIDANLTARHC
ncbi:hypothetical protein ACF0H5_003643 [Mactra antiquata]